MTADRDDDDALRQAFAELRGQDAAVTPAFADVVHREGAAPATRSLAPLLGSVLAGAALVASLVVGLLARRPMPSPAAMAATLAWTAPTDFLLRTPGIEVLDSVPRIVPRRSLLALDGVAADHQSNQRSPLP